MEEERKEKVIIVKNACSHILPSSTSSPGTIERAGPNGVSASGVESVFLSNSITIYTARNILTMSAENPTAAAVAVQSGRIVALGSVPDLQQQYREQGFVLDKRFSDKVIMPGFVDPHVHPSIAGTIEWFSLLRY